MHSLLSASFVGEPESTSLSLRDSPSLLAVDLEIKESEQKTPQNDEKMDIIKNTTDFVGNDYQDITKGFSFSLLETCYFIVSTLLNHFSVKKLL